MTTSTSRPPAQRASRPWSTWLWVLTAVLVVAALVALGTYLTTPRPGGRMDPESTGPDGAHALVALLRDHGVEVVVAKNVSDVEREARPDTLLLMAETQRAVDDQLIERLKNVPGNRLLVEPVSITREALAPQVQIASAGVLGAKPGCELPAAIRSGAVNFGLSQTYQAAGDDPLISCYDGALVRYEDAGRTTTVIGTADVMLNSGLLRDGNAALAMNLAGEQPRLIWYAPQRLEGERSGGSTILDLLPPQLGWIAIQLTLVVLLLALWKGRRMGPLVAEKLPVVVRASETVEGRGRLYRSQRARDSAAQALRTAALQRMLPRLGLNVSADPGAVVAAVSDRCRQEPQLVERTLYGPTPGEDPELIQLARELDDIERQVTGL